MAYIDPYTGYEVLYGDNPYESPYQSPYSPPAGSQTFPTNPNNPDGPLSTDGPPLTPEDPGYVPPTVPGEPPPTAPADPWATAPADGNWQAWFRTNLGRDTLTPAELIGLEGALGKVGIQVLRNASGVAGKIRLPTGQIVDVIQAAGAGGNRFQWLIGEDGGGDPNADIPAEPINPEYLAPFTEAQPDRPTLPAFVGPGEFQQPTGDSILQDPSYQFRVGEGRQALENSAAARGTLNSGGTLKDILSYGQKAASQEYQSVWDRQFADWNADWGNSLDSYKTNKGVSDTDWDRVWGAYLDRKNTWYANQSNPFQKLAQAGQYGG